MRKREPGSASELKVSHLITFLCVHVGAWDREFKRRKRKRKTEMEKDREKEAQRAKKDRGSINTQNSELWN